MALPSNYDFIHFSDSDDDDDDDDGHAVFPITFKLEPTEPSYQLNDSANTSNTSVNEVNDIGQPSEVNDKMDQKPQIQVPTHPIPSMQLAFAESMQEAAVSTTPSAPKAIAETSAARRKILLDQNTSEETHASRWRQKPGQHWHELWKLMAQISFGIYLLLHGIAKDDEQVMSILQGHVDEIDGFLETTLDDFDLAQEDIEERLKFLKLPLENIDIFDAMLEDRAFRTQIVDGNERIEHVIQRTASAMNDALKDVQQGLDACKEFTVYLAKEQEVAPWRKERPDMQKVFDAMKGNVEGWYKAYVTLQTKGNHLGVSLVQLGTIVAEMDKRAADVSRKTRFSIASPTLPAQSSTSPPNSPPRHTKQMRLSMTKDLPSDPNVITPAIRAALPAFQLVQDRERTPEPQARQWSPSPEPEPEPEPEPVSVVEPEPEFILKPRTYSPSPAPSPRRREGQPLDPAPETGRMSSLRKRFSNSLKRKETPSEITLKPPPSATEYREERQRVNSISTPPSRGLDSAYCSDFEKPLSPPNPPRGPPREPSPQRSYTSPQNPSRGPPREPSPQRSYTSPQNPPPSAGSHRLFPTPLQPPSSRSTQNFILPPSSHSNYAPPMIRDSPMPSPRSDYGSQFFRPVNASPHSPLQRPWTAGTPGQGPRSNSPHPLHHQKSFNPSHIPRQPSRMGMSMMSEMTTVTTEDGKKVKKKRSPFGWIKKAFSLSEEEKAAFEERRRQGEEEERRRYRAYGTRRGGRDEEVRFLDGRRIR